MKRIFILNMVFIVFILWYLLYWMLRIEEVAASLINKPLKQAIIELGPPDLGNGAKEQYYWINSIGLMWHANVLFVDYESEEISGVYYVIGLGSESNTILRYVRNFEKGIGYTSSYWIFL